MIGPVAIVTGARSGLGLALARELSARGARVAALVPSPAVLELATASPDLLVVAADVSDPADVTAAFTEVRQRLGPVEILINNAAVHPHRDFLDETAETFMATVGVNLGGRVACTREALNDMVQAGRGRVLNVVAYPDLAPPPASSAYSVSTQAARTLTLALLADIGDRFPDIVVGDWAPGILATDLGNWGGIEPTEAARWGADLALNTDPAFSGALFERDREVFRAQRLRKRLTNRILGRRRKPRRLGDPSAS